MIRFGGSGSCLSVGAEALVPAQRADSSTMPPTVGVFHPGTQHSWQTALAFQEGGTLRWLATSVFYDPRRWPHRIERFLPPPLAARLHREFSRRHSPPLHPHKIRHVGFDEWPEPGPARRRADPLVPALHPL